MPHSKHYVRNIALGVTIIAAIILAVILSTYAGGLFSVLIGFSALCLAVVWPIQVIIDHRAERQPSSLLPPAEMKRFKITWAIVIIGLVIMILIAVVSV
ncbi:MAG: hypothetical protein ABI220_01260 [Candidatus Saccharimonadales bacterium]